MLPAPFPLSSKVSFLQKKYRTRDRFIKECVYKFDLTTYQPSFCTQWVKLHRSFTYYISLCNFHLHLPIVPLSPYIRPIQVLSSNSNQFCTHFPWTYTNTFCFHYFWSLFPLLVIPVSLLFSHRTTKTFPPIPIFSYFQHFHPCGITVVERYTALYTYELKHKQ